jgi:hypothetical protein
MMYIKEEDSDVSKEQITSMLRVEEQAEYNSGKHCSPDRLSNRPWS